MKRGIILGLAGAMAIAIPAGAKTHPGNSQGQNGTHPTQSHKCAAHSVAYIASGTLVSSSLTKNANGTYSGTVTVMVKRTNHHGKPDKGTTATYTVTNAHVTFGNGLTNPPAAGSRVKVIGKLTTVAKKCPYATGTLTIKRVSFHSAAKA